MASVLFFSGGVTVHVFERVKDASVVRHPDGSVTFEFFDMAPETRPIGMRRVTVRGSYCVLFEPEGAK